MAEPLARVYDKTMQGVKSFRFTLNKSFRFRLNTDAVTFCTWLEDRSAGWHYSYTADNDAVVDIQKTKQSKQNSRTICSFDAVIEIVDDDPWEEMGAEKHLFKDFQFRKGINKKGVISIEVSPAPHAGKIDVRALCMDERALNGFLYVMRQIADAYPEAAMPIRKQQEEQ